MRRVAVVVAACLAGLSGFAFAEEAAKPVAGAAAPSQLSADECAVWARELGFARALAEHDAAGFAAFLHPQAAFGAGRPQPTRGREAIAAEWAGLIAGKGLRLRWYPQRVTIGGVGDVAWSTGPALYQRLEPGAQPRYLIGQYQSVWHRDGDGVWRILFDDGIAPRPATEAEAMAFERGRREDCPRR
ncbi:YybH family protein [Lysobacter enzymogenes]|uniref:YybH family protein n=1 Tax=Lysobacter enzymogenes TaxID=69 RepID=UPI00089C984B|nr:nuclear transport factor 2 family protein [Lysobacter enzymogenes]SDW58469.1 Ketosteroid isomerase homolog [Lysobacter enzymogenes]